MSVRRALGWLLILTASVAPCMGQQRQAARAAYSIAGTVRDDTDQHPMENIRVDLKLATGIPVSTTYTRGNGEFEFSGLANGEYAVEVVLKDYEPVHQRISVTGIDSRGVFIFMTRTVTTVNSSSGASISAHELGVPGKAHEEYEKALNLMYAKLDNRGAIVLLQRAIKDYPKFYEAYAEEGNAYMRLGETASAEEALRKSVDLSSGQYSQALFMLASLLSEAKRFSESQDFARKGISADGNSWQGPFELAKALIGMEKTEEAEKFAIRARDMKPDNPPVYLLLANILIHRQDYAGLLKDLDEYLKLVPSGPDADQARKARENIQVAMQQDAENRARANTPPPARVIQPPPPAPEPDTSGLPSLPPPGSTIQ